MFKGSTCCQRKRAGLKIRRWKGQPYAPLFDFTKACEKTSRLSISARPFSCCIHIFPKISQELFHCSRKRADRLMNKDLSFEGYLEVLRVYICTGIIYPLFNNLLFTDFGAFLIISRLGMESTRRQLRRVIPCHTPPHPFLFFLESVSDDAVKANQGVLLSEHRKNSAAERYSRLLAIESNEIEHCLFVRWWSHRTYILDFSLGKPDPPRAISILSMIVLISFSGQSTVIIYA